MAIQDLGTRLRHARKTRKVSQADLAKGAGVKQPSISELESGETKEIGGGTLIAVCAHLKVRPEWLVTGRGAMDVNPFGELAEDERDLIERYRGATGRWKIAIRHMAALRGDAKQDEAADSMNFVLAKIAAEPIQAEDMKGNWTRPDKPKP